MKVKTTREDRKWLYKYYEWLNSSGNTNPDTIKECKIISSLLEDVEAYENFSIDAEKLMTWVYTQITQDGLVEQNPVLQRRFFELAQILKG